MAQHVDARDKRKARIRRKLSRHRRASAAHRLQEPQAHVRPGRGRHDGQDPASRVGTDSKALKGEVEDDDKTAAAKKVGAALAKAAQGEGHRGGRLRPQRLRLPRAHRRRWPPPRARPGSSSRRQDRTSNGYSHQRERARAEGQGRPHQPRRQGREGRPALQLLGARRRRRRQRPRRRRPRQGERGPRGDPQGRRPGEEEPVQGPARRARPSRTRCSGTSAPAGCCSSPRGEGTGVIAGGAVRAVLEAAGHPQHPHEVPGLAQPAQRRSRRPSPA